MSLVMPTAKKQGTRSRPVNGAISEKKNTGKRGYHVNEARQSCAGLCGGVRGSAVKCGVVWERCAVVLDTNEYHKCVTAFLL